MQCISKLWIFLIYGHHSLHTCPDRKFDCTYSGRYIQAQLYNIQLGRGGERERGEEGMKEGEGGEESKRECKKVGGRDREKEDITIL